MLLGDAAYNDEYCKAAAQALFLHICFLPAYQILHLGNQTSTVTPRTNYGQPIFLSHITVIFHPKMQ